MIRARSKHLEEGVLVCTARLFTVVRAVYVVLLRLRRGFVRFKPCYTSGIWYRYFVWAQRFRVLTGLVDYEGLSRRTCGRLYIV